MIRHHRVPRRYGWSYWAAAVLADAMGGAVLVVAYLYQPLMWVMLAVVGTWAIVFVGDVVGRAVCGAGSLRDEVASLRLAAVTEARRADGEHHARMVAEAKLDTAYGRVTAVTAELEQTRRERDFEQKRYRELVDRCRSDTTMLLPPAPATVNADDTVVLPAAPGVAR